MSRPQKYSLNDLFEDFLKAYGEKILVLKDMLKMRSFRLISSE